jgi:FlaA1/EpsC-like NDP-sugar epimerase
MNGPRQMASEAAASMRELALLLFQRFVELPRNVKQSVLLVLDLLAVPLSLYLALWLRLGFADMPKGAPVLLVCLLTLPISAIVFLRLGLYRAIVRFMGHEALIAIIKGVTYSALVLSLMILLTQAWVPRSVPFLYWCLLLACVGGSRLFLRTWFKRARLDKTRRVAIYGAGSAGRQLLSALHMGKEYEPVLFVDDDPGLQGRVIHGVPVLAMADLPDALAQVADQRGVPRHGIARRGASPRHYQRPERVGGAGSQHPASRGPGVRPGKNRGGPRDHARGSARS